MAVQLRRGAYADFDPQKMKPAEVAVVQEDDPTSHDGKAVYVAIRPGDVKRMASFDEIRDEVYNQGAEFLEKAEQAANKAGWMAFEIVDGELFYERTPSVQVDFSLVDGDLVMEAINE